MKKKIIIYSILSIFFILLTILIKRYRFGMLDYGAALGILTLLIIFFIQLIFFKNRKITLIVGLSSMAFYFSVLGLLHVDWPQGFNDDLSIKANYESYNWPNGKPEDFGVNSKEVEKEIKLLSNDKLIRSFLIVKDGKLVIEEYFHGADANSAFNVQSVTKSILSALVGIAIDKGYIKSVDDKMINYFPEYKDKIQDQNKLKITIKDLLSMQEGLDVNSTIISHSLNEALLKSSFNPKTYKYFEYSTPSPEILSNIITRTSGESTHDFAVKELFKPIGIRVRKWEKTFDGIYFGSGGTYFTARDMARLGYLYLNNGNIEGKQLISEQFVKESVANYSDNYSENISSCMKGNGYGYFWWLGDYKGHDYFGASGYGGQVIQVIPDFNMVIVYTSHWAVEDGKMRKSRAEKLCNVISLFCNNDLLYKPSP